MCDRRYDLDCLDGIVDIIRNNTGVHHESTERQVVPTHNNNTQLLPYQRQSSCQQQQQQQQQHQHQQQQQQGHLKDLHFMKDLTKYDEVEQKREKVEKVAVIKSDGCGKGNFLPSSVDALLEEQPITLTKSIGSIKSDSYTRSMSTWSDENNLITCMFITANVGTIFEESTLLELWFEQLKSYLTKIKPQLVAIHCQEVGGKNYETSMKNVSCFTDRIIGDDKLIGDYSRVRIFLDENFDCLEKFTALGSLYLIHDSVNNVKLYNFKTAQYDIVEGRNILAASDKKDLIKTRYTKLESTRDDQETGCQHDLQKQQQQQQQNKTINVLAEHVEKIKFPQELFPECRWSRKGFMRTRWLLNDNQPLDLVNIHLFHDASNLVAMKTTPSPYAQNRQKALEFALGKLSEPLPLSEDSNIGQASHYKHHQYHCHHHKQNSNINEINLSNNKQSDIQQVPLFIFGDFNFRLNTSKVIQRITEGTSPIIKKNINSDEILEIVYHRKESDCAKQPICTECGTHDRVSLKAVATTTTTTTTSNPNEDNGNELNESEDGVLMTVGKKLFDYRNLDEIFRATKNTEWLLELDNELDSFKSQLYEFKISFSPSYPFKEDQSGGHSYMKTRCPAWCDRILFNEAGYRLINCKTNNLSSTKNVDVETASKADQDNLKRIESLQNHGDVIYRLMGNSVPMGDHKPVLLYCQLDISQQSTLTS